MGSPALVSVSCSTSYYYPSDCATVLTRRDPKHAHMYRQSSPLSHTDTGQAIPKSYFFWTLWEHLNLALAGSAGIIIKALVTRLPLLGGLAALEENSHQVEGMFPSHLTSTGGTYNTYFRLLLLQANITDTSETHLLKNRMRLAIVEIEDLVSATFVKISHLI